MQRYSLLSLARHALTGHRDWRPLWRKAAPKPRYSVIVIGGGGHGLATAYYLAKEHGIHDVAVLEKGAIGLGNTGRNTTIIRSNYLWDESARIYEHSLKLWEGLSRELNFNLMLSQRGVLNLAHSESDVREGMRRISANRLNGIDAEWLDPAAVQRFCPILDTSADARYPVLGACDDVAGVGGRVVFKLNEGQQDHGLVASYQNWDDRASYRPTAAASC